MLKGSMGDAKDAGSRCWVLELRAGVGCQNRAMRADDGRWSREPESGAALGCWELVLGHGVGRLYLMVRCSVWCLGLAWMILHQSPFLE